MYLHLLHTKLLNNIIMELYIQYGIIGIIFIVASIFLAKRMFPSNQKGGCSKGCGCGIAATESQKK